MKETVAKTLYIQNIAVFAPGMANWQQAQAVLSKKTVYQKKRTPLIIKSIPAKEKRRANKTALIAVHLAEQVMEKIPEYIIDPVLVFASFGGDLAIADKLSTSLAAKEPFVSPIQFHNSVHNAAAACWSIASHNTASSTSIAGGKHTFQIALLEAASILNTDSQAVLLVVYDSITPPPLSTHYSANEDCGIALLLTTKRYPKSIAQCQITLPLSKITGSNISIPQLVPLIENNAAMQGLLLLEKIAQRQNSIIYFPYRKHLAIQVQLQCLSID